jgi:acetyl esterase/lipase
VIILPHGGPWARDTWGYDSFAQFLANRGYAVLQPNFRGSTGYGRTFLDAGNLQWGTGAMQHDISDGVAWLIKEGIADPQRVAIMGGSYGGYATLAGLAFTPDLYGAGVSIVGPSSIPTLLASIPPYWAAIKQSFNARLGDPAKPADLERLKQQSPLYSATSIKAPLLVIQGANDPRVNKAESDQIVIALRDLKRAPEYLVAPDEGHGFAGRENRVAMFAAIERFLAKQLGGRYQQEMPKDIAARLDLLTVDVDTLKLVKPTASAPARFDASRLSAGTHNYQQTIQIQGQTIAATSALTLQQQRLNEAPAWLAVETSQSPLGTAADSMWLSVATLAPVRRVVHQGPAFIEVNARADSLVGELKAGAQQMPIRVAASAPVYVKGTVLGHVLGTLPLAENYRASLRTFDIMTAAVSEQTVQVVGSENVTVPAGTIAAFKVQIQRADGSGAADTYWIERAAPHRLVRAEQALPAAAGGGKLVTELK